MQDLGKKPFESSSSGTVIAGMILYSHLSSSQDLDKDLTTTYSSEYVTAYSVSSRDNYAHLGI